jgi:hypothetical protein
MNDEKWGEVLDRVKEKFTIVDEGQAQLDDIPRAWTEFVIFDSPMGRLKLERTTKPRVIDKKTFGGSKYGAGAGVEYIYSDTEQVHTLQAFREVAGEWQPISAEGIA